MVYLPFLTWSLLDSGTMSDSWRGTSPLLQRNPGPLFVLTTFHPLSSQHILECLQQTGLSQLKPIFAPRGSIFFLAEPQNKHIGWETHVPSFDFAVKSFKRVDCFSWLMSHEGLAVTLWAFDNVVNFL